MVMMNLIERLRYGLDNGSRCILFREAADEIERLNKQIELEQQYSEDLLLKGAELEARVAELEYAHHEIIRECSQENCDGDPWDTFQAIAIAALKNSEDKT